VDARLAGQIARFMQSLRRRRLAKAPGVAETLDWTRALISLHLDHLDAEAVEATLGCIVKDPGDLRALGEADRAGLVAESA
jgi:MoxR-like ATPase